MFGLWKIKNKSFHNFFNPLSYKLALFSSSLTVHMNVFLIILFPHKKGTYFGAETDRIAEAASIMEKVKSFFSKLFKKEKVICIVNIFKTLYTQRFRLQYVATYELCHIRLGAVLQRFTFRVNHKLFILFVLTVYCRNRIHFCLMRNEQAKRKLILV